MKAIINENQARMLIESEVEQILSPLPDFIVDKPLDAKGNPFANTGYFVSGTLNKLARSQQKEILSYFSDDITSYKTDKIYAKLSKLIAKCKKLEEPVREKLEKICSNTVVKIFSIPEDSIELSCKIAEISNTRSFHIKPDTDEEYQYESVDDMEKYDADTNKRRIINAMSYGAAKNIAEQSKKIWVNEVFDIDEELPHLYSQIMKINDYLIFNNNIQIEDKEHHQGGYVDVQLSHEDELPKISATGVIFPILLQESIRGIIDILSTYGLPDDAGAAKRVVDIADAVENDPWNMRFGPAIWNKIISVLSDFETEHFPYFYKKLVELDPNEFRSLMREVIAGTNRGAQEIGKIYKSSVYDREYNDFTNDLALKRGKDVISDDCFTDDEIESWGIE